ncbi:unnamed protein product [Periconia digitata]|uniref:Tat pathway signal sequence n=1 Tax=Periconia digitata TaxID=1303443 RepID=A0A9W4U476_9PLEO|nr:unnamed protein product [Periconia digitata]
MESKENSASVPFLSSRDSSDESTSFSVDYERAGGPRITHPLNRRWWMPPQYVYVGLLSILLLSLGFAAGLSVPRAASAGEATGSSIVAKIPVTFQEEAIFSGPPSDESNAAWDALIPLGRGFVELNSSHTDTDREGRYCVSVFHQLHCLEMIRQGFYGAQMHTEKAKPTPVAPDGGPVSPIPGDFHKHRPAPSKPGSGAHHADSHMQHCFDYLRQALMCASDTSLEERSDEISGVKGWGTTHQCRDFESVKEWAEMHRYSEEKGIHN